MRVRRQPIVLEAVQYKSGEGDPIGVCRCEHRPQGPHVHTPEGSLDAVLDDWILTDENGKHYVCANDIFVITHEEVVKKPECRSVWRPDFEHASKTLHTLANTFDSPGGDVIENHFAYLTRMELEMMSRTLSNRIELIEKLLKEKSGPWEKAR